MLAVMLPEVEVGWPPLPMIQQKVKLASGWEAVVVGATWKKCAPALALLLVPMWCVRPSLLRLPCCRKSHLHNYHTCHSLYSKSLLICAGVRPNEFRPCQRAVDVRVDART